MSIYKEEEKTGAILVSNILHIFILSLMMVDRKESRLNVWLFS